MIINEKEVLLLKSQGESDDKFGPSLIENGFLVKYLPVLEFVFINLEILAEELKNADKYSGIIFTSPRSVIATKMSLNQEQIDKKWHEKNNFVVGESTYDLAKNELNLKCNGKESGNADNLADLILKKDYTKPFLFPCGNLKKDTLYLRFQEKNLKLHCVTVYETHKSKQLNEDFIKITNNYKNIPEYFLFFSPSGVNFTSEIIKKLPLDQLKLIAIGPSTEKALRQSNLPVYAVAAQPNGKEVIHAILKT